MIVYITRHGQVGVASEFPKGHVRLSDLGKTQAHLLGRRLREIGFSGRVFVSPYYRCLQTAEIICANLGDVMFFPEPAVSEIVMHEQWIEGFKGLTVEEINGEFDRCHPQATVTWPWWPTEVETAEDVLSRVTPFIKSLLTTEEEDVLIVGHGATTNAVYRFLTDGSSGGHYNATLSAVRVKPDRKILLTNDTAHLGEGEVTSNAKLVG